MKNSRRNLIFNILTIIFGAIPFISIAFNFISMTNNLDFAQKLSFKDWSDQIKQAQELKKEFGAMSSQSETFKAFDIWNIAKTFMIILLIAVAVVVALAVIQMFFDNKIVRLVANIASIVTIALSVVFFVLFFVGCQTYMNSVSGGRVSPDVGPILILLFSVLSPTFQLITNKKEKANS